MAEIVNFSAFERSIEVRQILRLIKAFLAITDETVRTHLLAAAEGMASNGHEAAVPQADINRAVSEYLRLMVEATKST